MYGMFDIFHLAQQRKIARGKGSEGKGGVGVGGVGV
jgi:hypothetical protein